MGRHLSHPAHPPLSIPSSLSSAWKRSRMSVANASGRQTGEACRTIVGLPGLPCVGRAMNPERGQARLLLGTTSKRAVYVKDQRRNELCWVLDWLYGGALFGLAAL
jgi:hypothetical protein